MKLDRRFANPVRDNEKPLIKRISKRQWKAFSANLKGTGPTAQAAYEAWRERKHMLDAGYHLRRDEYLAQLQFIPTRH